MTPSCQSFDDSNVFTFTIDQQAEYGLVCQNFVNLYASL